MLGCDQRQQARLARLLGHPLPFHCPGCYAGRPPTEMLAISLLGPLQDVWLPCSATATPHLSCRTSHLPLPTSLASRQSPFPCWYGYRTEYGTVEGLGLTSHGPMSHGLRRWAPRSLLTLALPQLKKNSDGQGSAGLVAGMGWALVSS